MTFFCLKFGWTVDQVFSHSRFELTALLEVLDKNKHKAVGDDPSVPDELERRNIEKLKAMKEANK